jgi:5-methyltetrahydropteroyltriglutamate--homocysteine methyltransferase
MLHSTERILTTHTGSLPRPPELLRLYGARARGEHVDPHVIATAGHDAMQAVVRRQIETGIDVINNGEQQREGFFLYVQRRMTGFAGTWRRWPRADVERYPAFKAMQEATLANNVGVSSLVPPCVTGPIAYRDAAEAEAEPQELNEALAGFASGFGEAFMSAPSPGIVASACRNEHYATEEAYIDALAEALRVEYEAVVRAGLILQVDCPDLALERHRSYYERPDGEFLRFVERVVSAINGALRNVPRDRVRLHVCWGNYEGPHDCDVPLETIWPVIRQANVGGFVLPFANARHAHEFRVLEKLPLAHDQIIVAGVIDTLTNFVEHPQVVADRLERVAAVVGDPHRVLGGTDCGFDSTAGQGRVAEDVSWAKLASLVAGAQIASRRLLPGR